jgi:hypothetical protein
LDKLAINEARADDWVERLREHLETRCKDRGVVVGGRGPMTIRDLEQVSAALGELPALIVGRVPY